MNAWSYLKYKYMHMSNREPPPLSLIKTENSCSKHFAMICCDYYLIKIYYVYDSSAEYPWPRITSCLVLVVIYHPYINHAILNNVVSRNNMISNNSILNKLSLITL